MALREAASLDPHNDQVQAAFSKLQLDESVDPLLRLCQSFVEGKNNAAAGEILRYINSHATQVQSEAAEQSLHLLIKTKSIAIGDDRDEVVAALLQKCPPARRWLAGQLESSVTTVFEEVFAIGNGAATSMAVVATDPAAWPSEAQRKTVERDVFLLALAKLMESGHDYDGRAMREIARLLTVDGKKLEKLVDEESFDAILASLDIRWPMDVRSQATVAIAKFLEFAEERGQKYLTAFITERIGRQTNDGLIVAFSAAACAFPIAPSLLSALFLTEGFVLSLVPMLETKSKSKKVEKAALDMLNAACIDGACREAIAKNCLRWLRTVMDNGEEEARGQAAVVCAKLSVATSKPDSSDAENSDQNSIDLVSKFRAMLFKLTETGTKSAIEGLAYASAQPKVKEEISQDTELLQRLFSLVRFRDPSDKAHSKPHLEYPTVVTSGFGLLTIIHNLTRYLPALSEEQKRMVQLKAYANASKKIPEPDRLDDNEHVDKRCKAVLDAGVLNFLVALAAADRSKALSLTSLGLYANILLSLSRTPASRGKLIQQGALPLLLDIHEKTLHADPSSALAAAHAMARLLISVDPSLVGNRITSTVQPILSLLSDDTTSVSSDGPRDLLPVFEALLALTNLVSGPRLEAGPEVVQAAWPRLVDLLTSSNVLLQRATTELVCNLMTCSAGIEKFADGSKAAASYIHILLALADAEDVATRRAAGGALAMVTEFESVAKAVLVRKRGLEVLVQLMEDEDEGCVHRGFVCVRNMAVVDGMTRVECKDRLRSLGALDVVKRMVQRTKNEALLGPGMEICKALAA